MKQYIGIVRDHSASMRGLASKAMEDFNSNIEVMKKEARIQDIDTLVSVVECGVGLGLGLVKRDVVNSSVDRLKPLTSYSANGGNTPLYDSIKEVIDILQTAPDKDEPGVAFLVMVITDGQENSSKITSYQLGSIIKQLQGTDKWTFTFRVPYGDAKQLEQALGLRKGNVMEWEQSDRGFERATMHVNSATSAYYGARSMGLTAVDSFYSNIGDVPITKVKRTLSDITKEVDILKVKTGGNMIQPFVERETNKPFLKGAAFYQLTKPEAKVQSSKQVIIRDKKSGKLYGGHESRQLLGLPNLGSVKLSPGDHGQYDVFIQSTSTNRKLVAGTEVAYWPKVRF